jgi:hypothetical protein
VAAPNFVMSTTERHQPAAEDLHLSRQLGAVDRPRVFAIVSRQPLRYPEDGRSGLRGSALFVISSMCLAITNFTSTARVVPE